MYAIKTQRLRPTVSALELYKSVDRVLEAWARWRFENHGADVGFPRQTPFRRMMVVEGEANLPSLPISDDLAIGVDRAVSILKLKSYPVKGDYRWIAIMEAYLGGYKDHQIGQHHQISSGSARNARKAGENFIEGCLLTTEDLNENS